MGFPGNVLPNTIVNAMRSVLQGKQVWTSMGIVSRTPGLHLMPSNIDLADVEAEMFNARNRESILRFWIDEVKQDFDDIIIDCPPSLDFLTINALAAADYVIVPVQTEYLALEGMTKIVDSINQVKASINPNLRIMGAVLTMVTPTNMTREIERLLLQHYGSTLNVFNTRIPRGTKISQAGAVGESIFEYSPNSKVGKAYAAFVDEVMNNA
jgi:chromosome partitioning protein